MRTPSNCASVFPYPFLDVFSTSRRLPSIVSSLCPSRLEVYRIQCLKDWSLDFVKVFSKSSSHAHPPATWVWPGSAQPAAPGSFRNRVGAGAWAASRQCSKAQLSSEIPEIPPSQQPSGWSSVSWVKGPVLFKMQGQVAQTAKQTKRTSMDWSKRNVTTNLGCANSLRVLSHLGWTPSSSFRTLQLQWSLRSRSMSRACPGGNTPEQAWPGGRRWMLDLQLTDLASVPYPLQLMNGQSPPCSQYQRCSYYIQVPGDFIETCASGKLQQYPAILSHVHTKAIQSHDICPSCPPVVIWLWVHKPPPRALLRLYHVVWGVLRSISLCRLTVIDLLDSEMFKQPSKDTRWAKLLGDACRSYSQLIRRRTIFSTRW